MNYISPVPDFLGRKELLDIHLREIVPFINWKLLFNTWKLSGNYEGIETLCECESCIAGWLNKFSTEEKIKAEEAIKLFRDTQHILLTFLNERTVQISAVFAIYPASAENNRIIVNVRNKKYHIPTLRQQTPSSDGKCYALADFLNTKNDFLGLFACCVKNIEAKNVDIYTDLLTKTLTDRLVEATSEWLHFQIRKKYWGYGRDELLDVNGILKNNYQGIRPAVGYPSLPDQSIIFEIDKILNMNDIGIQITENGAMLPGSSICGLYFSHPKSKYFIVGKIDSTQFKEYSDMRDKSIESMKKWLSKNL